MSRAADLVAAIEVAFAAAYPGDPWLQGTFEGCEPYEEVGAFVGETDWRTLTPEFLDGHYDALSFFSEAGLRFFLPAFLVADLHDRLMTADPVFTLTHGLSIHSIDTTGADGQPISHRSGGSILLGPQRYGAITWADATRHRLSVFCREEAATIVGYLEYRRDNDELGTAAPAITAALESFWIERARSAPTRADLEGFRLQI